MAECPIDARFCQSCGHPLPILCTTCATANDPDARFCKQCGSLLPGSTSPPLTSLLNILRQSAPADLQDKLRRSFIQAEGERKFVSILFTDIVDSTTHASSLDPEEWKEVVQGAHRLVSEAVYRYEGIIAQLLGDGVLSFFGAPITHEDDPQRAVRAALDIQEALIDYRRSLSGLIPDFQMRIGIHTGTVVVGLMGSDLHMEYLAVGDSVNLAARLQSAAQPGGVLISSTTAHLVQHEFDLHNLGAISLKGIQEPQQVFTVHAPLPGSPSLTIQRFSTPLIGRQAELDTLKQAIDHLEEGRGGIVFILGEAGIGKSRLAEEIRRDAPTNICWLEGRSLSYGQAFSFWAITQLIRSDLGLLDDTPDQRLRVALRRRHNELFPSEQTTGLAYLYHLFGLHLTEDESGQMTGLGGETLKHQVMQTIIGYFATIAKQQPLVLVLEDLHWADASTLEVLEHLLPITDRLPLLLLFLARVDREHGSWRLKLQAETDYAHRYTELQLQPLSDPEANCLVNNLLATSQLPEDLRRLILERSDGNPLYLEEILRSLREQDILIQGETDWQLTCPISEILIPDTLQGVLLARIDRLEEDVRQTLQIASVIGRSFLYSILKAIAEAEAQLDEHLAILQRVDLVREKTRRPEIEYIFKHSLTQEAAYHSLLLERRKTFHRRVGEALETLFPERKDEFAGLLAHHFDLGGEPSKAIEYLLTAGDRMRYQDSLDESIRYFQRASELLVGSGETQRLINIWLKLGLLYHLNSQYTQAYAANEQAFTLQRQLATTKPSLPRGRQPVQPGQVFRRHLTRRYVASLDPGLCATVVEEELERALFAGLVNLDYEGNVVPHAARSWEVLDEGRRYLFHLRDDLHWSDGSQLTAADFEWALKRNLSLDTRITNLDPISGARDFRLGTQPNPDLVGVYALDPHTLEILLDSPVAFFLYHMSSTQVFPLPKQVIEQVGANWWLPEHIISNGPFRLVAFDPEKGYVLERNPTYFGDFPGNLERIEFHIIPDQQQSLALFRRGELDNLILPALSPAIDLSPQQIQPNQTPSVGAVYLFPKYPLDDRCVRLALAQSLDRKTLRGAQYTPGCGGFVPRGMAGHSPGICLSYDPELAQRLMAEAGYPNGHNFPLLYGSNFFMEYGQEIARQWHETLGIRVELFPYEDALDFTRYPLEKRNLHMSGVIGYPEPDYFLRTAFEVLIWHGWTEAPLEEYINQPATIPDRTRRMAMTRRADRFLVVEQALVIPLIYGDVRWVHYLQSWVHNFRGSANTVIDYRQIKLLPH